MKKLFKQIGKFADKTFPKVDAVGHLRKAIEEVEEAILCPVDAYEYADILIAVVAAAHKAGIKTSDLEKYTKQKLQINKKREWEFDEEKQNYHHKKS